MENTGNPTHVLGVTLLHKCNFNCSHCGYLYAADSDDHEIKPGYRLSWEQIKTLLVDCGSVKEATWSFVMNGGEPTLWEEGAKKFIDVLLATQQAGIFPTYNTNGSYFIELDQTRAFFNQYADSADLPLMTAVSMDKFHDNYDRARGRADSLDNITRVLAEMTEDKRAKHRVHVITIVSKDPNSRLPEEMKAYYGEKGITFGDFPLLPVGKAKLLEDELPDPKDVFGNNPPSRDKSKFPIATLIGNSYMKGSQEFAKLGYLKDAFSRDGDI